MADPNQRRPLEQGGFKQVSRPWRRKKKRTRSWSAWSRGVCT